MKTLKLAAVSGLGLSLFAGSLLAVVPSAGAAGGPPPTVIRSPNNKHLAVGESATFKASAQDATTYLWQESSDGGSNWSSASGTGTAVRTKSGVLKISLVFGPFSASENGWELRAVFVNDPTGVPSGVQASATTPAVITAKKTPKG
jgi:hypothetical protein